MSHTRRGHAAACALLLCAVALTSSCWWGYAPERLFAGDVRTVYVEFFDNKTFRRELEVALTRAVVDQLKLRTPLTFAPRNEADSVLSGELVEFTERTKVKTEADDVLKTRVSAKVRFRWTDRRTGTDLVPQQTVSESVRIVEDLEGSVSDLVLREVAEAVVEAMEEPW